MSTDPKGIRDQTVSIKRFGKFEVDLKRRELRRRGMLVHLQAQPFTLLSMLVERPNEVVSREEMRQALWGDHVIVDFEPSLSSAVKKLREALNDVAANPLFIETVARHGYRFIAPVTEAGHADEPAARPGLPTKPTAAPVEPDTALVVEHAATVVPAAVELPMRPVTVSAPLEDTAHRSRLKASLLPVLFVVAVAVSFFSFGRISRQTGRYRISQVTPPNPDFTLSHEDRFVPGLFADGARIYFSAAEGGQYTLRSALAGNGESTLIHLPTIINTPRITDISPDLSRLLLTDQLGLTAEHPLWVVPVGGGGAKRLTNTMAHDAIWTRSGDRIVFARDNQILEEDEAGDNVKVLATLPGRAFWLRFSPNGNRLRFTLTNPEAGGTSIWEMQADGSKIHVLMPRWQKGRDVCCGSWTEDGKHFIFTSDQDGHSDLWRRDESPLNAFSWWDTPHKVTDGPMDFHAPSVGKSGASFFAVGIQNGSRHIRFDPTIRQILPNLPIPSDVERVEFSGDGKWMAWIDEKSGSLWRSQTDGSLRLQLTPQPVQVLMMSWSPDASTIAYIGRTHGSPWRIYLVSSTGGKSSVPVIEKRDQVDVTWSPDGQRLVFGRLPGSMKAESEPKHLYQHDLRTHQTTLIPVSEGITSPRLSPNGKLIAAIRNDSGELALFDFEKKQWKMLVHQSVADPVWSHDGRSLYFLAFQPDGRIVYRLHLASEKLERIIGIEEMRLNDVASFWFHSLAPGDMPIISIDASTTNIYKIDPYD